MMTLSEAARGIGAALRGSDVSFGGVSSDSRAVTPGSLFVALKGERYDAHEFVAAAFRQGAVAAMVQQGEAERHAQAWQNIPLLVVADTRLALGRLAAYWRSKSPVSVVAVTGSNGKTTVKDMLASILAAEAGPDAVLATRGNLNNDIGVPLTLLALERGHRYAVIEMGMNHPGEIAYLTDIARPGVALINNAQAAHLAGLGSVEQVARAKGEIFQGLLPDGIAVINADDPHAPLWRRLAEGHRVVDFGLTQPAAVSGDYHCDYASSQLDIRTSQGNFSAVLQVPGVHNVRNALAATAAAVALGIGSAAIRAGLEAFAGVKGRLQRKEGLHGAMLIDDSYNANPASVEAAIAVLARAPGKKVLVLGDMGELGPHAVDLHRHIGEAAKEAGVDVLFALGEASREAVRAFGDGAWYFERIQELLADLENLLAPGVTVLVKGSRFMQMERVVNSFARDPAREGGH